MTLLGIPDDFIAKKTGDETIYSFNLTVFSNEDKVRFKIDDESTSWMDLNDGFIKRISFENLNPCFMHDHIMKEIKIRNILGQGELYLGHEKYQRAIECFDEVIWYDESYGEALLLKSRALFYQKHFVKALRYYKKTVKADAHLKDIEYHKLLLKKSSDERDSFPKIKRHIYTGDELFSRGKYAEAIEHYDRALGDPSKFKSKILYKIFNKKATALFRLNMFEDSLEFFEKSLEVQNNDYAQFMCGFSRHALGLNLNDGFSMPLKITKSQQLYRALIFNEEKLYDDAIKCIDDLLSNHFTRDKIYFIALSCKISSMESLGIYAQDEKDLLERL